LHDEYRPNDFLDGEYSDDFLYWAFAEL
jgi:hypothetical protein